MVTSIVGRKSALLLLALLISALTDRATHTAVSFKTMLDFWLTQDGAVLYNRKGIGIEIDDEYCDIAKKRILEEAKLIQSILL